jgi:hypothetical protein
VSKYIALPNELGNIHRADNPVVVTGLTFEPSPRTDRLLQGFVQDELGIITKRLSLTVGTKFLQTNFTPWLLQATGRLLCRYTGFH